MLHAIFGGKISAFATNVLGLNPQNIFNLVAIVIIQVGLGTVSFLSVQGVKKLLGKVHFSALIQEALFNKRDYSEKGSAGCDQVEKIKSNAKQ